MIAAALFLCASAVAIDGDTLRCDGLAKPVRLAEIDAPEMPGHCRKGRDCAPGDPVIARDVLTYLLGQLDGRQVWCLQVDARPDRKGFQSTDPYGRPVARCSVDGEDLGQTLLRFQLVRPWP
jgi:micrococcal nuclease